MMVRKVRKTGLSERSQADKVKNTVVDNKRLPRGGVPAGPVTVAGR